MLFFHLPSLSSFFARQTCTKEAAISQLDLRWFELDANALIDLLFLLRDPPESLQRHMDTRILELVETMSIKQLVIILGCVSQGAKPNIPLLKGLCYHLAKNTEVLTFEQGSKVGSRTGKYHDPWHCAILTSGKLGSYLYSEVRILHSY